MQVLGIVASPRRERGRCHEVVSAVLEGARAAGAETDVMYLIDDEPEYCVHCGYACFSEGDCAQEAEAGQRSARVDQADALAIAVPVYCWQACGLATAFFDKIRLGAGPWTQEGPNGRHALGIAVAGGTGTGVFPALQSIYAWLCLWKYRPLDPVPVTRFNMRSMLDVAPGLGRELATRHRQPFDGVWEQLVTYDALPYMGYGRVDEFRWLAEQTAAGLEAEGREAAVVAEVRAALQEAQACAARGDREGEARNVTRAYLKGRATW